jgi:hypothetical protein
MKYELEFNMRINNKYKRKVIIFLVAWFGVFILFSIFMGIFVFHTTLSQFLIVQSIVLASCIIAAAIILLLAKIIIPDFSVTTEKSFDVNLQPLSEQRVKIEYDLNKDDFMSCISFYSKSFSGIINMQTIRILFVVDFIIFTGSAIFLAVIGMDSPVPFSAILGFLAFATLLLIIFYLRSNKSSLERLITNQIVRNTGKLTGKHEVVITPNMIIDKTEAGELKTRWNSINYIASNDRYLFIPVRGSLPHIIPARAFADEAEFKRFVEAAKAYHKAAKAK